MPNNSSINYFENLADIVNLSIIEDVGSGDITAQLVPEDTNAFAFVISRENAIVCGRPWFDEVFKQIDSSIKLNWLLNEGESVSENQKIVEIQGNARSILTAERCALNFLQTLMGTATTSYNAAIKLKNQNVRILDTRKTIPGLRLAQKYAVKIGGCDNHRIGLYDAFLIKENHITACGSIQSAVARAREVQPNAMIEIEVESISELRLAISTGVDRIMLDNFSIEDIKTAIKEKNKTVEYEISGNIDLSHMMQDVPSGIDYLSSGALTKHCRAIDLSMRLQLD